MPKRARRTSGRQAKNDDHDSCSSDSDDAAAAVQTPSVVTGTTTTTTSTRQTRSKPYISRSSAYFTRSRQVLPILGLTSYEVESVNELEHTSPISNNVAAPMHDLISWEFYVREVKTVNKLEHASAIGPISASVLQDPVLKNKVYIFDVFVKVLPPDQNSMPNHSKGPVGVFGHKFASIRNEMADMNAKTSMDKSQSTNTPITEKIPVAEISQERCPDLPLVHVPLSLQIVPTHDLISCEVNTVNELEHASAIGSIEGMIVLDEIQDSEHEDCGCDATGKHNAITKSVPSPGQNSTCDEPSEDPVRVFGRKCASVSTAMTGTIDAISVHTSQSENGLASITENISGAEISQEHCPDLPLAHFSSSDVNDQLQQPEPVHKNLIEISGNRSNIINNCNLKPSVSFSLTDLVNLLGGDDDEECSSRRETTLETVEGYNVRKELVPTLRMVISKHGDIAGNSSLQHEKSRSLLLEQTCEVVEQLQSLNFSKVMLTQLESMRAFVTDLEHVIDVKWLGKRLDDIMEAKSIVKQSGANREERMKKMQGIEETEKVIAALQEKLKGNKEKLVALKNEMSSINRKRIEATSTVKRFYNRSLMHDLL